MRQVPQAEPSQHHQTPLSRERSPASLPHLRAAQWINLRYNQVLSQLRFTLHI